MTETLRKGLISVHEIFFYVALGFVLLVLWVVNDAVIFLSRCVLNEDSSCGNSNCT